MRKTGRGLESPRLRVRVRRAILALTAGALALFAVPLAVAVQQVTFSTVLTRLQRDATRAVTSVPDNVIKPGRPVQVRGPDGSGTTLAVYSAAGRLVGGVGPARSVLARQAVDGREHDGQEAGDLAVVVPVPSDTSVVGSVRAAVRVSAVWERVALLWALMAALAALTVGLVAIVASRVARRIARPFEELTTASRELGAGSFALSLPRFGLREADEAGVALEETAERLGALIRRERDFTEHASHQLRTPLAGLLVGLEAALEPGSRTRASTALSTAAERARQLARTIDDLLAVRSSPVQTGRVDVAAAAAAAVERWSSSPLSDGRSIRLRVDAAEQVIAAEAVARQCLDVLLDNALRHGRGNVTVTVERLGDLVAFEVADEGPGLPAGGEPGLGLQLAEVLAESAGGRILVRRRSPRPRLALVLPASTAEQPSG